MSFELLQQLALHTQMIDILIKALVWSGPVRSVYCSERLCLHCVEEASQSKLDDP